MKSSDSTTGGSSGSSSSRGNGGKAKRKNQSATPAATKKPQRGMGVAQLERIRLSVLNKPYQQASEQEFGMGGQGGYHSVYAAPTMPAVPPIPSFYQFYDHQRPNTMMSFGGLEGVNMPAGNSVNQHPSSSYATDSNLAWAVRHHQQQQLLPQLVQSVVIASPAPTFSLPSDARNNKLDSVGVLRRRYGGQTSGPSENEEIDLELRLL